MEHQELVPPTTNDEKATRKRKFNPEEMWAKCRVCQEIVNLEHMIYQKVAFKDPEGRELFGCFEGVYFCGVNCQELFKN